MSSFDEIGPGFTGVSEWNGTQYTSEPVRDTAPHLTGQQRQWVAAYIRQIADLMYLQGWTFHLMQEPSDADTYATVKVIDGRQVAQIWVSAFFVSDDPADARNSITHELVHVVLERATAPIRSDLVGTLGRTAFDLFYAAWHRDMEGAVDHLATLIAGNMPMPPWSALAVDDRQRSTPHYPPEDH